MLAAGANLAATMEELQQQALNNVQAVDPDMYLPFLDLEEMLS